MTRDDIREALALLPQPRGLERFIRLLGFTATLRPRRPPRAATPPGAVVLTTRRDTLRLHAVRMRQPLSLPRLHALLRAWRSEDPASHHVVLLVEPRARRVAIGCECLDGDPRHVVIEPDAVRASDVAVVHEIAAATRQQGSAAAFEIARALDRRTLSKRFFRDVRAVRDLVARHWLNVPVGATADREALALLLLSRLLFLYFLQQKGLLDARERFLPELFASWRHAQVRGSFYRTVLRTLFFGVLNRRPERRTRRALALGTLPYLNGGLFEPHRLERQYPRLDLPDDTAAAVFDMLLERYRFTAAEPATGSMEALGGGIDPELLGQIFEGLMPGDARAATGTFYTPPAAVDRLVLEALVQHLCAEHGFDGTALNALLSGDDAAADPLLRARLRDACSALRVVDPACGSGAFLVGALGRIAQLLTAAEPGRARDEVRRDVVARSLYGVDVLEDAALICSLRLWLALVPECRTVRDVPPLPNLDRCIRQGDALVDPLDTRDATITSASKPLRAILRQLEPAGHTYLMSEPESRPALRRRIQRLERALARTWLDALERRLQAQVVELRARAADHDLFGGPTTSAMQARALLPSRTRRLDELCGLRAALDTSGALPFFSFPVHFAAATSGFDLLLSNPPWIRAHTWPAATTSLLRERYRVCSGAGWPHAAALTGTPAGAAAQVDLAFLFLERGVSLLRDGGTMGVMLPAKLLRSLAPGTARELLLRDAPLTFVEDHSLHHRAIFSADAFTSLVVARRSAAPPPRVQVRMTRAGVPDLEFSVARDDLPLLPGDLRAPWLLAPPQCADALRAMQRHGVPLGRELAVRRGAMTAANDRMIVPHAEPRLGELVEIRTARGRRAVIESDAIRPVLRGAGVRAWRAVHPEYVLWSPANDDRRARAPRRLAAFLEREAPAASATAAGQDRLRRIGRGMFGHKVAWSDVATDLRAAAVGPTVRACGADRPLIPLNTVYFTPVPDRRTALLLSAYLNSLPLRTFARAIAERAKDAHFRFLAWTVALLPLPTDWRTRRCAERLVRIAQDAHDAGGIDDEISHELDATVASCYSLDGSRSAALASFDRWLRGIA